MENKERHVTFTIGCPNNKAHHTQFTINEGKAICSCGEDFTEDFREALVFLRQFDFLSKRK